MKKIYTFLMVSLLVIASLGIAIYQYVATTKAELANAANTKPANGHSWNEMESDSDSIQVTGQKITNLSAPTAASDAATKAYVDAASGGGTWDACYVLASASNGTACAAGYTSIAHVYGGWTTAPYVWTIDYTDGATNSQGLLMTIGGEAKWVRFSFCHNSWSGDTCYNNLSMGRYYAYSGTHAASAYFPAISIDTVLDENVFTINSPQTYAFCCK